MEALEFTSAYDPPAAAAASEWGELLDFVLRDDEDSTLFPPWTIDAPDLPIPPLPPPPPPRPSPPAEDDAAPPEPEEGDPCILCSSYRAGRLPCSCPPVDEASAGSGISGQTKQPRKAPSVAPLRCQVPGCGADTRELKGYHRRHRVCVRCACASSVVLEGEIKRYCQQCGKFHILTDFDEGKRSCRRKLERHNKRRRRKNTVGIEMVENYEKPQGVPFANVFTADESRKEFTKIGIMESTMARVPAVDTVRYVDSCQFASRLKQDGPSRNDERVARDKQIKRKVPFGSEDDGHDSCFRLLGGFGTTHGNSFLPRVVSDETQKEEKADNFESSISSPLCNSNSPYSSVCPTGRISFKLYDWNLEEFPRQLRHQVFKWLSSMPVELEGYVRPGCIILTMFIAMPEFMWGKLSQDAVTCIHDLIYAPESLLVGRGNINIFLPDTIVQISKDQVPLVSTRIEVQIPRLHHVYPTFFEAGQPVKFVACGSNLSQTKFRFLVSFAGKYLELSSSLALSPSEVKPSEVHDMDPTHRCGNEMFRITIPRTDSAIFGPAFIEVENELGTSNFIPIVFTNKPTYFELERIHGTFFDSDSVDIVSKQTHLSALLLDIAWVLRDPGTREKREQLPSLANVQRLTKLLMFLLQIQSFILLRAVLDYSDKIGWMNSKCESTDDTFSDSWCLLLKCINQARELLLSQPPPHLMRSKSDSEIWSSCSSCSSQTFGEEVVSTNRQSIQDEGDRKEEVLGTAMSGDEGDDEATAILVASLREQSWIYCRPNINVCCGKDIWRITLPRKADKYLTLVVAVCAVMCLVICLTYVCAGT